MTIRNTLMNKFVTLQKFRQSDSPVQAIQYIIVLSD